MIKMLQYRTNLSDKFKHMTFVQYKMSSLNPETPWRNNFDIVGNSR